MSVRAVLKTVIFVLPIVHARSVSLALHRTQKEPVKLALHTVTSVLRQQLVQFVMLDIL